MLERAKAWSPQAARKLDVHIAEHPDALTAPSPHCPGPLPRLLQVLEAAGHGDTVTQLACAICGRAGRKLPRPTPHGRACDWCVDQHKLRTCARCGKSGLIAARSEEEGGICRSCYKSDRRFTGPCAECGRRGTHQLRRRSDSLIALCRPCAGFTDRECVRCGTLRSVHAHSAAGPVCQRCYVAPAKLCGKCGQFAELAKRGERGELGVCYRCYTREGVCTVCGRFRDGAFSQTAGGAFLCDSCRPRPSHRCADCGCAKKSCALWPVGHLCYSCYSRRRRNPESCSLCGIARVLVDRNDNGAEICGPCCGADIDFSCQRCGSPGDILGDGCCVGCVTGARVNDLLADEDGRIVPALKPLALALGSAPRPRSVLAWLRRSPTARLLAALAASHAEITHELLDDLSQNAATRNVRDLLVHTRVLPPRQEYFNQLELWFRKVAQDMPTAHIEFIRPFAEWFIIRDARRRANRGRYSLGASTVDRNEIRAGVEFMQWLDGQQMPLTSLTQTHLDVWLTQATNSQRRSTAAFIRWTNKRGLTHNVEYPGRPKSQPILFLDDEEHEHQLRRCLTDASLPLELRVAGALIRLYGLPLIRIVHLTTDGFHQDEQGAFFTFDKNPVLLPPTLARLIEQQITTGRQHSALGPLAQEHPRLLLPGRYASRARSPHALSAQLTKHGLPTIAARNTAMFGMAGELPPIVISDLFGVHRNTATQWAALAQDSWADYLAALRATE
ncbi:XRE family transcriptional regulator [Streptomyces sp. CJ_13]|nr:XRE family transcriptional regulator [Streptomyces sp. CJ_13]